MELFTVSVGAELAIVAELPASGLIEAEATSVVHSLQTRVRKVRVT